MKTLIIILSFFLVSFSLNAEQIKQENFKTYLEAAQKGDANAQYDLAVMYEYGSDANYKDIDKALFWYKRAVAQKFKKAEKALKELEATIERFQKIKLKAEQGDVSAQNALAYHYELGMGVNPNYEEARKWYKKAIAQGHKDAVDHLKRLETIIEANALSGNANRFKDAAEKGDAQAQLNMGIAYARGNGVKQDMQEAIKWWKKSAEQGKPHAAFNVAYAYFRGDGVECNFNECIKWLNKAGDLDEAQFLLCFCYANGYGVERNYKIAVELLKKLVKRGNDEAWVKLANHYITGVGTFEFLELGYACLLCVPETSKSYTQACEIKKQISLDTDAEKFAIEVANKFKTGDFSALENPKLPQSLSIISDTLSKFGRQYYLTISPDIIRLPLQNVDKSQFSDIVFIQVDDKIVLALEIFLKPGELTKEKISEIVNGLNNSGSTKYSYNEKENSIFAPFEGDVSSVNENNCWEMMNSYLNELNRASIFVWIASKTGNLKQAETVANQKFGVEELPNVNVVTYVDSYSIAFSNEHVLVSEYRYFPNTEKLENNTPAFDVYFKNCANAISMAKKVVKQFPTQYEKIGNLDFKTQKFIINDANGNEVESVLYVASKNGLLLKFRVTYKQTATKDMHKFVKKVIEYRTQLNF